MQTSQSLYDSLKVLCDERIKIFIHIQYVYSYACLFVKFVKISRHFFLNMRNKLKKQI